MKILVAGRNYTSRLGMIRAVGQLGFDVIVIKTVRKLPQNEKKARDIDYYSKYVKGYYFALEPDRENLISVIKNVRSSDSKNIIIPVDDYVASTIDGCSDDLKDDFLFPSIDMRQGAINHLMDKDTQKRLAKESGLSVASGKVINVQNGLYDLPDDIKYPCFPKPQISYKGNKKCMKCCYNEADLRGAIDEVLKTNKNCPFVVEDFIEIEKEYATLGFSDGKNVVIPGMIQLLKDGSGSHKGVTLLGKLLPPEDFSDFLSKIKSFILKTGFVGLFDVDSYVANNVFYFNELNLRFGASGYALTAVGINLPKLLINTLIGKHMGECLLVNNESLFVNEKVAYEDYKGGYITKKNYNSYLKKADIAFIRSDEDKGPYKEFRKRQNYISIISFFRKFL